jgi:transposase
MLKKPELPQQEMELVTIESLVPGDHLLRKIHASIDLEFNGRPALDPVVLFKLLLIGYLFGIRSKRQLMRDVQVQRGLLLVSGIEADRAGRL